MYVSDICIKFNSTNLLLHTSVTFTDQDGAFKGTAVLQNISDSTRLLFGCFELFAR